MKKDVVIIGAGAAGSICAIEAAARGRSVLVVDHMARLGSKIRISGGGRCNFTNLSISPDNYRSDNSNFCRSALARFGPADITALLDRHRVRYREKADGQLFCLRTSEDILNVLRLETARLGIAFSFETKVRALRKERHFEVATDRGHFSAGSLVVATGGLSYPNIGASSLGYVIAKQFGLKVTRLRPGLVPLTLDKNAARQYSGLSGTSLPVEVTCRGRRFGGSMLFTHTGLSGPVILQTSLYWEDGDELSINLLPDTDLLMFLKEHSRGRTLLSKVLSMLLPKGLALLWTQLHADIRPICQFSQKELEQIAERLHNWKVRPAGTEGYDRAEVTVGGVDTSELSSRTMEARKVPGLYFIGEVIDVTGALGGYNLQWAWSSGFVAGQYV